MMAVSEDPVFGSRPGLDNEDEQPASKGDEDSQTQDTPLYKRGQGSNTQCASSAVEGEEPIYALSQRIFLNLEKLANSELAVSQEAEKTRARFAKWCKTLGAHLRGVYSLDERLRDASAVKRYIVNCLGDITDALEETQSVSHKPETTLSPSTRNEDTALKLLMEKSAISDPLGFENSMLDVLFRVIPVIRPALSADRYEKAMATELLDEDEFKQICSDKLISLFPEISSALLARLVLASLQRRRFFHYTANYSLKFQSDGPAEDQDSPNYSVMRAQSNIRGEAYAGTLDDPALSSMPPSDSTDREDTESILSKADSKLTLAGAFSQEGPAKDSDTDSMISMAKSNRETAYSIPAFPEDSENGLRECVACHLTLPLPTKTIWRAHILRDIRPYVCTFPDCNVDPNKLYSSRRVWFEHELTFHRRQWSCPLGCATPIGDLTSFQAHIASEHPTHVHELSSDALPRIQEISANAEARCPFCLMNIKPRRKIESHIASHQVQVGLMVLQSSIIEDSDEEEQAEEEEEEEVADMPNFPTTDLPTQPGSHQMLSSPSTSDVGKGKIHSGSEIPPKENSKAGVATKSVEWDEPSGSVDTSQEPVFSVSQHVSNRIEIAPDAKVSAADPEGNKQADGLSVPLESESVPKDMHNLEWNTVKHPTLHLLPTDLKSISSARRTWFLMPSFDFPPTSNSSVRLEQVLTDPLNPENGILDSEKLDAIISRSYMPGTEQREVEYDLGNLQLQAMTLNTYQLERVAQYVARLEETPEVRRILREKNRFGSRKIYVITGLKIITDSKVVMREEKSRKSGASVSISVSAGIQANIGYGSTNERRTSFQISGPVIFAYCLAQVRTSFLGSQAVARYTKGAAL